MKKNKKAVRKVKNAGISKPRPTGALGQPYGDRVLVKPSAPEEVTSFGLIIPDTAKEKPEHGVVVAVGPGKKTEEGKVIPLSVKVGDCIMFSKYGYDEVKINGVEYYLIREDSITMVLNK
ncbi:MAG: 10 kDa chaperonin [Candidatus Adlerbacteria bacterium GW2011_GWA1_54_10]|uniref:Co-chaperonin GroES n=2 Tax=Candidatus Adleribacteriota TaxID=1752736 RepID=A0A0G2A3X4_9BACT|nr:MAG: 10 kDa chaperonin [Candidatus Adlerbacteria bacterium GW2011_GWA1_54_10]KKW37703.1 MAG: 10 kDa chaperonin [Candidatus Adlerbacteria bacterium GW2011_GWB1_54_7]